MYARVPLSPPLLVIYLFGSLEILLGLETSILSVCGIGESHLIVELASLTFSIESLVAVELTFSDTRLGNGV